MMIFRGWQDVLLAFSLDNSITPLSEIKKINGESLLCLAGEEGQIIVFYPGDMSCLAKDRHNGGLNKSVRSL